MMYSEFTELSKMEVGFENYSNVIEPMYNAVEDMSKADFIEFIKPAARKMAKEYKAQRDAEIRENQKTVFISNGQMTPNGCWYIGQWAKLVDADVNVRTGRAIFTVRNLTEDEEENWYKTNMMNMASSYDIATWSGDINWQN